MNPREMTKDDLVRLVGTLESKLDTSRQVNKALAKQIDALRERIHTAVVALGYEGE